MRGGKTFPAGLKKENRKRRFFFQRGFGTIGKKGAKNSCSTKKKSGASSSEEKGKQTKMAGKKGALDRGRQKKKSWGRSVRVREKEG